MRRPHPLSSPAAPVGRPIRALIITLSACIAACSTEPTLIELPPERVTAHRTYDNGPVTCDRRGPPTDATPRIYVIGDSTAAVYVAAKHPLMGWAQTLQDHFQMGCAVVEDKALPGRSSKSFYDEGVWDTVKDALSPGDFVLIQFGHNDAIEQDPNRYTEPFGTYQDYLTVFVNEARNQGATPIFLTPVVRNRWEDDHIIGTHGDYPQAMRMLAADLDVIVVDMTTLTQDYFESLGEEFTSHHVFLNLPAGDSPNYPDGKTDNTHFQEWGARRVADLALWGLARQKAGLAPLALQAPTYPAP